MLLTDHILVQTCLDLVRHRHILDIQLLHRLILCFLFLLDLLPLRDGIFQIRQIQKLDSRYAVHQLREIHGAIGHRVKASLHTALADGNVVRQLDHLPGSALRAVAHEADLLVLVLLLLLFVFRNRHFFFLFRRNRFFLFVRIYYDKIIPRHSSSSRFIFPQANLPGGPLSLCVSGCKTPVMNISPLFHYRRNTP